jgi:hypothetical protein
MVRVVLRDATPNENAMQVVVWVVCPLRVGRGVFMNTEGAGTSREVFMKPSGAGGADGRRGRARLGSFP